GQWHVAALVGSPVSASEPRAFRLELQLEDPCRASWETFSTRGRWKRSLTSESFIELASVEHHRLPRLPVISFSRPEYGQPSSSWSLEKATMTVWRSALWLGTVQGTETVLLEEPLLWEVPARTLNLSGVSQILIIGFEAVVSLTSESFPEARHRQRQTLVNADTGRSGEAWWIVVTSKNCSIW
uniref:NPHN protein n=1 Tax=Macrostomum lignano TaxID=282301 RepID=A0A1I8FPG3_9PLAT